MESTRPATISLLNGLAYVGIDEGRTVLAEFQRRLGLQGYGADVGRVVDVQVAGRGFLEEGAGARAAGLVHGVVDGHLVAERHVLGVLAADLENGVDARVEKTGAHGVGQDLVVDPPGAAVDAQKFAGGSGSGHQRNFDGVRAA
jgi:hypothetical protein